MLAQYFRSSTSTSTNYCTSNKWMQIHDRRSKAKMLSPALTLGLLLSVSIETYFYLHIFLFYSNDSTHTILQGVMQ